MDCPTLLESLDSLWFFSNIITPLPSPSPSLPLGATDILKPIPPPVTPQLNSQLADSPNNIGLARKEFSEEPEQKIHKPQSCHDDEVNRLGERNNNMERRMEISNGKQRSRKKSQRFHKKEIDEAKELMYLISASFLKHRSTYHRCSEQPVGKDLAMKKQLRSWAHAVACTVR